MTLAAIAVFAVLAVPATAQQQADEAQTRGTVLNINAQGVSLARPDMATVTVGVATQGQTAQEAVAENARRMNALVQSLRRSGLAERDIQTAYVRVSPRYQYRERLQPLIVGYDANNSVRARVRRIDNTGRTIDAVVAAGGNTVQGVAFSFQEPEAQLDMARRDAVSMARRRAELYADGVGLTVVRVISITESGAAAPSFNEEAIVVTASRLARPDYQAPSPIAPGELETRAQVSVAF
jgi:uncharacterized protein YggE